MDAREVPSWAKDPWNNDVFSTCEDCGAFYELVRPGKSQPTCDCHLICPEHGVREEYRSAPSGHVGGGIFGWVCPECYPPCECSACQNERDRQAFERKPS